MKLYTPWRRRTRRLAAFIDAHPAYCALFVAVSILFVDMLCASLSRGFR